MIFKIILLSLCASVFSSSNETDDFDWWQNTIIYQVYPRSFKDSDGDGLGDLKGIEEKADYFKWLGVGAIWLNPIFYSPMVDFGYDIANYTRLDATFGSTDDLKSLVKKLKEIGVKFILDFVPNHTSSEHEWFKKSVEKIDPYTDYYIWKDPKVGENGEPVPPNNWISAFNIGPAWSYNPKRGQYYLHHFHKQMPDLNYRNEHVLKEMENVLRFWLDTGVDGIRFDAVPYLIEDENFPDEAYIDPNGSKNDYFNMVHNYTKDYPGTYEILRKWRILMDNYTNDDQSTGTRLVLTEAYTDLDKTMMYYGTEEEPIAHIPFNFELIVKLSTHSNSKDYVKVINDWINSMPPGKWPNWVIGNHDRKRVATLFGPEMVDVLNIMVTLLPGTCVNYYGDELGMENAFIRWDQTQDPQGKDLGKDKYEIGSRDGCRTPMQWDNTMNGGFSTINVTWLPVNPNYWHLNLKAEKKLADSHVNIYRKLAAARKLPTLKKGEFQIYTPDDWTIVFTRTLENQPSFIVVLNIGTELQYPDITGIPEVPKDLYVYTASNNSVYRSRDKLQVTPGAIQMRPKSAIVLTSDLAVVTNADNELGLSSINNNNHNDFTLNCQPVQNKGVCQLTNNELLYHERCD